ncbi:MAG: hypothetical protein JW395_1361 [Nitrospira sp.]|nr:hypothetical protein [Nitrospira sp.]
MADRLFYGTAFAATAVRHWLARVGRQTLRITPGSPWENGSIESLTGMVRDDLLDRKRLDTLWDVTVVVKRWRHTDTAIRPYSALGYRPPVPETIVPQYA